MHRLFAAVLLLFSLRAHCLAQEETPSVTRSISVQKRDPATGEAASTETTITRELNPDTLVETQTTTTTTRETDADTGKVVVKKETATTTLDQLENVIAAAEGFRFGVALSVSVDTGSRDRVDSASVVNGVVRVSKDSNTQARFMLESHYFFVPRSSFLGLLSAGQWGWGPFVGLQPGGNDIIDGVGAGLLLGLRREVLLPNMPTLTDLARDDQEVSQPAGDSFNLGIGVFIDPDVQVLGDGIVANQPLPDGETEVRYKNTTQVGLLIAFSYSF